MAPTQIGMYQQKLSGLLDHLFTKVISGTSIELKNLEYYQADINKLSRLIMEISDQIALERCQKLNKAVLEAFNKIQEEMDKRFKELESKES